MRGNRGVAFLICVSLVVLIGCSDTPKGFPKVLPCTITVLDGTTPIADVEVTLQASTPADGTIYFGKTDASGICAVGTSFANYYKKGVPEGNYKVILIKEPFVEDSKTKEEQNKMSRPELDAYRKQKQAKRDALPRIIPVALIKASTTQLSVDVKGKETALTVNVAEHK